MQSWPKVKLGQVWVDSNLAQNHSSYQKKVMSYHYLHQITCTFDQKWNYVKLESVWALLIITFLAIGSRIWSLFVLFHINSQLKVKLGQLESVRTLLRIARLPIESRIWSLFFPNSHEKLTKSEIMSNWSRFEHCSELLVWPIGT